MIFPERLDEREHPWMGAAGPRAIWAALKAAGGEARIVGGAVRDALLGRKIEDIDFASNLPPDAMVEAFEKAGLRVVPTGLAHGTVTVVVNEKGYEVTSLRRDLETDGRRAKVVSTDRWEEDAARRDLTFNALYLDSSGQLYDFTGGRADLAAGRVRFIGDPRQRIAEDYLRILRFFRFWAQMSSPERPFSPDLEALKACREMAPNAKKLSVERVWREFSRLLTADNPVSVIAFMEKEGVVSHFLEGRLRLDRLDSLINAEKSHGFTPDPIRRLAALLEKGQALAAKRLKLSGLQTRRLTWLGNILDPSSQEARRVRETEKEGLQACRQILYDYGAEDVQDAALLLAAEGRGTLLSFLPEIKAWKSHAFPLRGGDVTALGLPSGPQVGAILARVEAWWRKEDFLPSRKACLEKARELAEKKD